MRRHPSLLVALLLAACLPAFAEKPASLRVLFVGNSLTYTNDLPSMVARLGALDGRRVETRSVAEPDYSLGDHLRSRAFRTLLRENWDFVVLQQGPSSLPASSDELLRDTRTIASLLSRSPRPKIALLMIWPPRSRAKSWDGVIESYTRAASGVDGLLIPAGIRVRQLVQDDPSLPLLLDDGFHPAVAGTYLTALVTYRALTNGLPAECGDLAVARKVAGASLELSQSQLRALVHAAARFIPHASR